MLQERWGATPNPPRPNPVGRAASRNLLLAPRTAAPSFFFFFFFSSSSMLLHLRRLSPWSSARRGGKAMRCLSHGGGKRCSEEGCNKGSKGVTGKCIAHGVSARGVAAGREEAGGT